VTRPPGSRKAIPFEVAVLLAHVLLALAIRSVAWPEITTPAYLWSRGMVLYRDVKFLHTPGLIGLLAVLFRAFGPATWVVRAVAVAGPLAAHAMALAHTRSLSAWKRLAVSGFFLVAILVSDGNAVWPTVMMAALSLPIASDLTRGKWLRAGLAIGAAILMKQTAAAVLVVVVAVLLLRRSYRAILPVAAGATIPYAAALVLLAPLGAAREMLFWTAVVPFRVQELTPPPGLSSLVMLAAAFAPTAAAAWIERKKGSASTSVLSVPSVPSAAWLLAVAFGFALLCLPNFLVMQTVAALPCLAVGAARLFEIAPPPLSRIAVLYVATWTLSRAAILAGGATFDARVLFWNEDPAFNAVIARLERFPPETRVHSELWGNVLPRSRRLPPGGIWVHPWLRWYFQVEDVRHRVLAAAETPGTVCVDTRTSLPGERIGPYSVRVIGTGPRGTRAPAL
jgi:hypothetical protein